MQCSGEVLVNSTTVAPSLAALGECDGSPALSQSGLWPSLVQEAGQIGVEIDPIAAARLARYRGLLIEWNSRMNLTAVRDPQEMERKLFLDAVTMIPLLDTVSTPRRGELSRPASLIDIGTGAGFPGLVLKLLRPTLEVTLVDATAKKVAFLQAVIDDLKIAGVRAVHGRAEDLGQDRAFRERFDIATARAVAALPVLLEYLVPFLRVGGGAILPKGIEISDELRDGALAARVLRAEIVGSPLSPISTTRLIQVRKTGVTPAAYPRRTGVPAQSPLVGGG